MPRCILDSPRLPSSSLFTNSTCVCFLSTSCARSMQSFRSLLCLHPLHPVIYHSFIPLFPPSQITVPI